ncbi:MAG: hypothetical protein L0271_21705 [Gemmatimonadetes bacterium]|nr:hypothetical protein [Gemmatimonadota bacterium]
MIRSIACTLAIGCTAGTIAAQTTPAGQIAAATLAAPADRREAAGVLGYDANGGFVTLREGTNDLICTADEPETEGFETSCYHKSLEPYMARGRELRAQGVTAGNERNAIRWKEIEEGKLAPPDASAIQYILAGRSFDPATRTVDGEYRRSVIYIPYATAESTGLSQRASNTEPWIMYPGTPGAHIMITPPRARGGD